MRRASAYVEGCVLFSMCCHPGVCQHVFCDHFCLTSFVLFSSCCHPGVCQYVSRDHSCLTSFVLFSRCCHPEVSQHVYMSPMTIPVLHPSSCLTRFNKIAIQGTPQMAVDNEAICLSRVCSYYPKCNFPLFYV